MERVQTQIALHSSSLRPRERGPKKALLAHSYGLFWAPLILVGSLLWAPVLYMVYSEYIQGFQIRGPYQGTVGSTLEPIRLGHLGFWGFWQYIQ